MLYFDPQNPIIDVNTFTGSSAEEFREKYREAYEQILIKTPKLCGCSVSDQNM